MVKSSNFVESDSISASKATWDDDLTLTFCEICVKEVDAGNRPTTHLNTTGWENAVTFFKARTQKNYGKPQLKNKWDTLKKEWRLWNVLLKNSPGLGWCSFKRTIDATEEWWAEKLLENPDFKGFKKKGIEPRLNELLWKMFGDVTATGEPAWAVSSGVVPNGVSTEHAKPVEGSGDTNEHGTKNKEIPNLEVALDPSLETSSRGKRMLGVVHDKGKKSIPIRRSIGKTLAAQIEKLCQSMANQRKSMNEVVSPRSQYTISDAMDALRALENEIPKKHFLYFFATQIFQVPVKREMFLNLDQDIRAWWLQREYDEQNANARLSSLLSALSHGIQQFQPPPPPQGP
ncbi:hypothetical protein F3Y22_tig00111769pilonHSYRG00268 [Hibiscus syriacus]|uniref:Myb/SANT-like domain-containing protein n=1 Tax=Hibiscus syriacus TaxID=106335 RepID=A0A6A2YFX7_HIBSY|nr:L10-interacting MYB domain-containing protein-like [Hibiscus syriacus]KAE8674017.1 hypothetical protein F3Y22_tig00111769pilonHSYRG00268 [Hibiscus syriacus]